MTQQLLTAARTAFQASPPVGDPAYTRYCRTLAEQLTTSWAIVLKANEGDIAAAERRGLSPALLDRLRLADRHLAQLVALTKQIEAELPAATASSASTPIDDWGELRRVPKPLGVIFMVYEARPTVTVEGALLPVVAGNAVILRGGKEMAATDTALAAVIDDALADAGLPVGLVTTVPDPDRSVLRALLKRHDAIDVLIPRGSLSLIEHCRSASSIPVIASGGGVNHLYVHRDADLGLASAIALDSKLAEPTACNTVQLVLVDSDLADEFVRRLVATARTNGDKVALRLGGGLSADSTDGVRIEPLAEHDLGREFLDATIGVLPVADVEEAAEHVRRHGSGHTEGVVSADTATTERFTTLVDAAAVIVNGSLRLHDGPTLGLGSEISISTGRLHVRGSVTIGALLTHSWVVDAKGALRAERNT
jgi:glutamate-5-semialdehyde dehydrogenase